MPAAAAVPKKLFTIVLPALDKPLFRWYIIVMNKEKTKEFCEKVVFPICGVALSVVVLAGGVEIALALFG